jgi:hypothetical protein
MLKQLALLSPLEKLQCELTLLNKAQQENVVKTKLEVCNWSWWQANKTTKSVRK